MTASPSQASCQRCRAGLEHCAVCDDERCPEALCSRCVRIAMVEEIPQPHEHGG